MIVDVKRTPEKNAAKTRIMLPAVHGYSERVEQQCQHKFTRAMLSLFERVGRSQKHNLNRNHRGEMCDAKLMLFKMQCQKRFGSDWVKRKSHNHTITERVGFIEHGMIKYLTTVDAFICCAR